MSKDKDSKDSFVFYRNWYKFISECDDAMQLKIYQSIMDYVFNGQVPQDPIIRMLTNLIMQQIDDDKWKYAKRCEKNRAAGKKHKGNQYTRIKEKEEMEQTFQNGTDNDNDNDNDNESKGTKVPMKTEKNSLKRVKKDAAKAAALARENMDVRKKVFHEELKEYIPIYGEQMVDDFYAYWTEDNKSHTQFRKEMERTWDLSRRLRTWARRENKYQNNSGNGTIRQQNTERMHRASAELIEELLNGEG